MLHMIGGLDNPTSGQVIVDGQNLSHMTDEKLTIFRRRNIGFVFQQYNLVPMLNVLHMAHPNGRVCGAKRPKCEAERSHHL